MRIYSRRRDQQNSLKHVELIKYLLVVQTRRPLVEPPTHLAHFLVPSKGPASFVAQRNLKLVEPVFQQAQLVLAAHLPLKQLADLMAVGFAGLGDVLPKRYELLEVVLCCFLNCVNFVEFLSQYFADGS